LAADLEKHDSYNKASGFVRFPNVFIRKTLTPASLMKKFSVSLALALGAASICAAEPTPLETRFRELPMEARRLTGPLFWMHGDAYETRERLESCLEKVAEGGNGCFTAESRPHNDWLGPRWFNDLEICLNKARKLDLRMWIFDERWWPSQSIGGTVPPRYAAKSLVADAMDAVGPGIFESDGFGGERHIAAVAGRMADDNRFDGDSLLDLAPFIKDGKLVWQPPRGKWRVVRFTHKQAPGLGQRGGAELSVDGASRDCTEWFLKTVYQPHHDRFKDDFGTTIPGFFYDEPETVGDWGTEVDVILKEWGVDWKKAYVAYKFQLAGDDDAAARYQYMEAFAEAWGRVMYGGMSAWCRERGVVSIGHFMEHNGLYLRPDYCAGDMMRLQKYSDMGGIDLVCRQMYPGQRPHDIYQTPKLGSSISHVYGKKDDIAMCEIFGGYGQELTYPQMKWLTDQHQVRGINFLIPHSFNPKAPYDKDYPPYFDNDGHEPRWPLYRVWADYTSRLSLMLTGGHHVCPVAILFSGNARRIGNYVTPEHMTTVLQDALYDCDWLPFEAFENDAALDGANIKLHDERYQVLIVPPADLITVPVLAKAKAFFDQGGVVLGYGRLPSQSGTIGKAASEIAKLRDAIWGASPKQGSIACLTNPAGGRSYYLPEKPDVAMINASLGRDAGIPPVVRVIEGETNNWLHALHRVKDGMDVFLICNQDHAGEARTFRLKFAAEGFPEIWDAMRNDIQSVDFTRDGPHVEIPLTLEPMESVLVVFNKNQRPLPPRPGGGLAASATVIPVNGGPVPPAAPPKPLIQPPPKSGLTLSPVVARTFEGTCQVPDAFDLKKSRVYLVMETLAPEEAARVTINGRDAGGFIGRPLRLEVTRHLKAGSNTLRIEPFAPESARLIITNANPNP
jgi:hypothetical protein